MFLHVSCSSRYDLAPYFTVEDNGIQVGSPAVQYVNAGHVTLVTGGARMLVKYILTGAYIYIYPFKECFLPLVNILCVLCKMYMVIYSTCI